MHRSSVSYPLSPLQIILDVAGVEHFHIPDSLSLWGVLAAGAILTGCFNYLLNWGIVLSTPLFMRTATSCSIPLSFVVQLVIVGSSYFNWMRLAVRPTSFLFLAPPQNHFATRRDVLISHPNTQKGAALVLSGFLWFTYIKHYETKRKTVQEIIPSDGEAQIVEA